jgi:uncharacterized SAM-binding protein YcdF (DUF218 family)
MANKNKKLLYVCLFGLLTVILLAVCFRPILTVAGRWLVVSDAPSRSDAIVVLNTGVEIYPRLIQAAELYNAGYADKIIINGNRKTDVLRDLEKQGFQGCCEWYENSTRILVLLGVLRENIIPVSAEDAYDTVSEAEIVGKAITEAGIARVILATSKSHTRRARFIWKKMYGNQLVVSTVAAASDIYNPHSWWREGKQIRWVLGEYGAWIYYFWKVLIVKTGFQPASITSSQRNYIEVVK